MELMGRDRLKDSSWSADFGLLHRLRPSEGKAQLLPFCSRHGILCGTGLCAGQHQR